MTGMTERTVGCGTRALVAALASVLLSGCSASTTGSSPAPTTSTVDPDGSADVALLDTGPYAVAATSPYGTAGDNRLAQAVLESQRLAAVTVGPWQVDRSLTARGAARNLMVTGVAPTTEVLTADAMLPAPLPGVAARHGLMAGFSSLRLAVTGTADVFAGVQTVLLRFPDPNAAASAAAGLFAADPGPAGADGPRRELSLLGQPDALAAAWSLPGRVEAVHAVAAEGPFVLYAAAQTPSAVVGQSASTWAVEALTEQRTRLTGFTPTPADRLADLPLDPSGFLLARTLPTPDGTTPANSGAWAPAAWLHFEDDPLTAATWLAEAGVDYVAQRLGTVYRTRNAEAAETLLRHRVEQLRTTSSAAPTAEVPGLPRARCFERTDGAAPPSAAPSWQRIAWHFTCAAAVDRYVFTVYAASQQDAAQRLSAQWRILAGK